MYICIQLYRYMYIYIYIRVYVYMYIYILSFGVGVRTGSYVYNITSLKQTCFREDLSFLLVEDQLLQTPSTFSSWVFV